MSRKRAANAFRKYAQQISVLQYAICAFLACHHSAKLPHEIADEGHLQQSGMSQKSRHSACSLHYRVQGHEGIKGHKSAVGSDQDCRPLLRKMLETFGLDAPVPLPEKFEYCLAVEVDCVAVHSEFIKYWFRKITGIPRAAQLTERSNTRL